MHRLDRPGPAQTWSRSTSRPRRRSSATSPGATSSPRAGSAPAGCRARRASRSTSRAASMPSRRRTPCSSPACARRSGRRRRRSSMRCGRPTPAARAWPRSAPAPSSSRTPACSTAAGPRRTGPTPSSWPSAIRRSPSIPACSTSTRATCSPRPASPRASTSACTSCAATTAPRWPTPPRGGSSWRPHRDGGQAQFVDTPLPAAAERGLAPTRAWALERLREPLTVRSDGAPRRVQRAQLRAALPRPRRAPPRCSGCCCSASLHARRLLESTDLPVEDVADHAGFGTATSLRSHFRRATATTPVAYRRSFRGSPA